MGCVWYQNADLNLKFKDPSFPYGWGGVAMPKRAKRAKRAKSVFFFFSSFGHYEYSSLFFYITFFFIYMYCRHTFNVIGLIFFFLSGLTIST